MKKLLSRLLYPVRSLCARFVNIRPSCVSWDDRIYWKAANLNALEKISGDYLEFGVFRGGSMIEAYGAIKNAFERHQELNEGCTREDASEVKCIWENMRFFAFDSFQGLPEPVGVDKESCFFSGGKYAFEESRFKENLESAGIPLDKVVTVPGWFQDTCIPETSTRYGIKHAAIIHVDVDWYSSTQTVLAFITPLLVDGTVIIFDDWYTFHGNPEMGEQKAFNEWRAQMPDWLFVEYHKEGPWRNSFIATKRKIVDVIV
ncbi:MAG: TylF/MycF/NovP-related O-methyltransferase [Chthoniobacteraceae bacterium]